MGFPLINHQFRGIPIYGNLHMNINQLFQIVGFQASKIKQLLPFLRLPCDMCIHGDVSTCSTGLMALFFQAHLKVFPMTDPCMVHMLTFGVFVDGKCGSIYGIHGFLVGGLNPSEKYQSIGMIRHPIYGKIKNVPNHQPDSMGLDAILQSDCFFHLALNRASTTCPAIAP